MSKKPKCKRCHDEGIYRDTFEISENRNMTVRKVCECAAGKARIGIYETTVSPSLHFRYIIQ